MEDSKVTYSIVREMQDSCGIHTTNNSPNSDWIAVNISYIDEVYTHLHKSPCIVAKLSTPTQDMRLVDQVDGRTNGRADEWMDYNIQIKR